MSAPERIGDPSVELEGLRREIGRLDGEIVGALARRVRLAQAAATAKRAARLPTLDPPREAAVVRRAAELAGEHGLPPDPVRDIFWQVIELCRQAQAGDG